MKSKLNIDLILIEKFLFLVLNCFFIFSCATMGPKGLQGLYHDYPPGVDSTVFRYAIEEAEQFLAPYHAEQLSSEDKKAGMIFIEEFRSLDSLRFPQDTVKGKSRLLEDIKKIKIPKEIELELNRSLEAEGFHATEILLKNIKNNCIAQANQNFANSYLHNPFDVDLLLYYGHTEMLLGSFEGTSNKHFTTARDLINEALRLDKGGHDIYFAIGETYRFEENWKKAVINYIKALTTLRAFEFLPRDLNLDKFESYTDSVTIYRYLYIIGDMYTKLHHADSAIAAFNEALKYTLIDSEKERIENYIKWIQWADGDIEAREKFEEATALEQAEQYVAAAEIYLDVIKKVKNVVDRAYWETSWRLSKLEVAFLLEDLDYLSKYRKNQLGLNRLRKVIKSIPKDTLNAPIDTLYQHYFNDYAIMLWNEAQMMLKGEGEKRESEKLFAEGAILSSNIQVKSCLQMTKFYQSAPLIGLLWAFKTYSLRKQLDKDEISELFVLFKRVTRRPRNPIIQAYFNQQFLKILEGTSLRMDEEDELMAYEMLRSGYNELDRFLYRQYGVRQDPFFSDMYKKLYIDKETTLSMEARKRIRKEIFDFYYKIYRKPEEKGFIDDWKAFVHTLRVRELLQSSENSDEAL